jgi:hypothetical protein
LFEDDDEIGGQRLVTLAAWALVERSDGDSQVIGLVQRAHGEQDAGRVLGLADEVNGFIGYTNQGLKTKPAD